jgi:hypothetical protein
LGLAVAVAACSGPGTPTNESADDLQTLENAAAGNAAAPAEPAAPAPVAPAPAAPAPAANSRLPAYEPPAPGEPGGLPDDRTPISEAPFTETSAQGAANVVQTYFALVEAGKYQQAWQLWSGGGNASGMSAAEFAKSFARYREYHANVGAPGRIEGAAGSLYVEVPVQIYGRLANGRPFNLRGPVTLRRVNDVPGSTAEQRKWHIASIGAKQTPPA